MSDDKKTDDLPPLVNESEVADASVAAEKKKKKKKKKNKAKAAQGGAEGSATTSQTSSNTESKPLLVPSAGDELNSQLQKLKLKPTHDFWKTQPVPQAEESFVGVNDWIHPPLKDEEIQKEPYPLKDLFHWEDCNIDDDVNMTEIYTLLNENYVEDDDNMFRFDYSKEFLRWALKPPGFRREWHVGVRVTASKKLVAFISAIPATLQVYDKQVRLVEINFLCVHKKLRSKKLAPVLIKEITRRVHVTGLFQAVYTAGVVLPKPVASCRYWHRSLNPKKLIEVGFSHLAPRMTMARTLKLYKLDDSPKTPGFREMKKEDVPQVHKLLNAYLKNYSMAPIFDEHEIAHWLTPQRNIVNCYVVEDPATKKITDLVSFYTLPSSILGNQTYKTLKAAYSFYNVATKTPLIDLMTDALVAAKNAEFDVFNALDIFENESVFKPLKFGIGDGHLQYYLYNWKCPSMSPKKIGLVLL